MSGLIIDLQKEAIDPNTSTTYLLRKALLVSTKLKLQEFKEWIELELQGYEASMDVPPYRQVHGQPKGLAPQGWIPLFFEEEDVQNAISKSPIFQPIAEIEHLVKKSNSNTLRVTYSHPQIMTLCELVGYETEFSLMIPIHCFENVSESIRTKVLNWALELEQQGILGEGMSFSDKEIEVAQSSSTTYNITHIGNMSQSQIQQGSAQSTQNQSFDQSKTTEFIKQLKDHLEQLNLTESQSSELGTEIGTIDLQLDSPKPKPIIITESLKSIRTILEGVSGSVIASGLLSMLENIN